MLGKLMSDPMRHVRRGQQWAKGPGRFLLARLRVRHLRIVWTVTEQDAAATAVTYGALMAACNTAWAILRDHVDAKADELRLEPDFTGERAAERCFACQITARMYIIVATALLTMQAAAKRRAARARASASAARISSSSVMAFPHRIWLCCTQKAASSRTATVYSGLENTSQASTPGRSPSEKWNPCRTACQSIHRANSGKNSRTKSSTPRATSREAYSCR